MKEITPHHPKRVGWVRSTLWGVRCECGRNDSTQARHRRAARAQRPHPQSTTSSGFALRCCLALRRFRASSSAALVGRGRQPSGTARWLAPSKKARLEVPAHRELGLEHLDRELHWVAVRRHIDDGHPAHAQQGIDAILVTDGGPDPRAGSLFLLLIAHSNILGAAYRKGQVPSTCASLERAIAGKAEASPRTRTTSGPTNSPISLAASTPLQVSSPNFSSVCDA